MAAVDSKTPTEIELKLTVQAAEVPKLLRRLARFGSGEATRVDNVYYDTADCLLAQQKMALRVRRIGRRWVQTLKSERVASALAQRDEWEVPAPRGRLDPARFPLTPLAALLQAHPQAKLQPVFRTRFARTSWQAQGGAVEIVFDDGEIVAGDRRAPILELELELKSGSADALYRLGLNLAVKGRAGLALVPATASKAARGYRLAAGRTAAPVKGNARAVVGEVSAQTNLAAALRGVIERATTVLLTNAAGHQDATDPEFVHQARVAVRRMRSATRLLGKAAGWPTALDEELRWVGRKFGAVRDSDVLLLQTLPDLLATMPADAPLHAWVGDARRQRQRADLALCEAMTSARFARLALRLLQWSHTRAMPSPALAEAAAKKLRRLHARLFSAAAFFAVLPASQQHRVRIHAKRLRYALDLFACVLPSRSAASYGKKLAHLQDELGALNDIEVAMARLKKLGSAEGVGPEAVEWFAQRRQQHALKAEAALADLSRTAVP